MWPTGARLALLLLAAAAQMRHAVEGSGWSYKDPSQWPGVCATGNQQSPIDLAPAISQVTQFDKLNSNYESQVKVNLVNNGHTVDVSLEKPSLGSLSGGGLPGVYYLNSLHFHWGSEHTVQGRRLPLEMHMVHFSKQYSGVSEALKYKTGLAVVGVLFKESNEANPKLEPLLASMTTVNGEEGKKVNMNLSPGDFLPGDLTAFYRYEGSLTTPGCNESVLWTVMMATVPISKQQLDDFVTMKSNNGLIGFNYRPVQKLNRRVLIVSRAPGSSITPYTLILLDRFVTMKSDHGLIGINYRPVQKVNGRVIHASRPPGSAGYTSTITKYTLFLVPIFYIYF